MQDKPRPSYASLRQPPQRLQLRGIGYQAERCHGLIQCLTIANQSPYLEDEGGLLGCLSFWPFSSRQN